MESKNYRNTARKNIILVTGEIVFPVIRGKFLPVMRETFSRDTGDFFPYYGKIFPEIRETLLPVLRETDFPVSRERFSRNTGRSFPYYVEKFPVSRERIFPILREGLVPLSRELFFSVQCGLDPMVPSKLAFSQPWTAEILIVICEFLLVCYFSSCFSLMPFSHLLV